MKKVKNCLEYEGMGTRKELYNAVIKSAVRYNSTDDDELVREINAVMRHADQTTIRLEHSALLSLNLRLLLINKLCFIF